MIFSPTGNCTICIPSDVNERILHKRRIWKNTRSPVNKTNLNWATAIPNSDYYLCNACKRINQSIPHTIRLPAGTWIASNYEKAVAFAKHLEKV